MQIDWSCEDRARTSRRQRCRRCDEGSGALGDRQRENLVTRLTRSMNAGALYLGSSSCARPRTLAALPVMSLIPPTPLSAALTAATLARNLFLVQRARFPGLLELTGCCVDRQSRFQRGRDEIGRAHV